MLHPPHIRWHLVKPWDRHSLILLTAGLSYILIGITYSLAEVTHSRRDNLKLMDDIMPIEVWVKGFILVGAISIISSRWPSRPRTLGYATLTGWTSLWAGFYVIGGLMTPVNASYVTVGLSWATMAFLWWAVSGLISPPKEMGERGHNTPSHRNHLSSTDSFSIGVCYPKIVSESEPEEPR